MSDSLSQRSYLIERAPSRNGPWRYAKSLQRADIYQAIREAHGLLDGQCWLRIVPEGRIEHSLLVRGNDE
jgi:hypothetical protein